MKNSTALPLAVAVLGLAGLVGCGGTSSSASPTGAAMNVHLVDGPISGFQEIDLNIQTVEISSGGGAWITLGTPGKTVNLLNLVGGIEETLAHGATLPAGHYDQMRLVLGSGNSIVLADGTSHALTVPSGMQTGIKLIVSFDVAAGTTKDVWIDFDAAHSIQVVGAGASGKYMLRPTVWAYDKVVTGSISGKFTDSATGAALAGVAVLAETLDGSGNARISRSTVTDATGAYTLDLLPVGATYYVVSQPQVGAAAPVSYDAKASDAFALTGMSPVFTYSAAFMSDAATGSLSGGITPLATADQSDLVNLLASLASPTSGTHTFIVRTNMAALGTATETFGFTGLPAGAYSLQALRATQNPDGTTTASASAVVPAAVVAGATATVNLGF
ncbi:DUF4382 domain-containing protein [Mesoterricola silvestris]|uniref:DUF4382 domain-containing protein n=1 Tax=Mesoterricola silvestris TaxID=2927979 RepID=A0AA48GPZ7_9BACT|nr:DUF4382 domain-containing protein [Mesoterricola silvestris]BDU71867.1 hypothetical protein METEAL_10410 [Mesoterricola silvestris]